MARQTCAGRKWIIRGFMARSLNLIKPSRKVREQLRQLFGARFVWIYFRLRHLKTFEVNGILGSISFYVALCKFILSV
jgi:hypothetical protein